MRKIKRYLSTSSCTTPPRDAIVLLSLAMQDRYEYLEALLQKCRYSVDRAEMKPRDWLVMEMYRAGKDRFRINDELDRRKLPLLKG